MPIADELICHYYADKGLSCAQIAEIDGRSQTTVYNRLRAKGVAMRSRSAANQKFSDRLVIALYNLCLSSAQIARLLGVHPTTVVKRLQLCGFPMRPNETALAVAYTDEEFRQHFCNPDFLNQLSLIQ